MSNQTHHRDTLRAQPRTMIWIRYYDPWSSFTPSRWTSRRWFRKLKGLKALRVTALTGDCMYLRTPDPKLSSGVIPPELSSYPGTSRTTSFIQHKFWWPGMRTGIQNFVSACSVCAQAKVTHQPPHGLLQPLPIPHRL